MAKHIFNVEVYGYGAEIVMGTSSKKTYQYFKKNNISLDDFNNGDSEDVPEDLQPFYPGEWSECDDIAHANGASMDTGGFIQVTDENGELIFESSLELEELIDQNIDLLEVQNVQIDNFPKGTVIIQAIAGEKGQFFNSQFESKSQFKPNKMLIKYGKYENNMYFCGLDYEGEEIYDDGGSTRTNSFEIEFLIV